MMKGKLTNKVALVTSGTAGIGPGIANGSLRKTRGRLSPAAAWQSSTRPPPHLELVEIAIANGFADQSHITRVFSRSEGLSRRVAAHPRS